MKRLFKNLGVVLLCCLFVSCDKNSPAGFGTGGAIERISVRERDESVVLQKIKEWAMENGFEESSKSWAEVTGQVRMQNNKGEEVLPAVLTHEFDNGEGYYHLGLALSTQEHTYLTVFSDVTVPEGSDEQTDGAEAEFTLLEEKFHKFVETEFPMNREGE